MIKKIIPYLTLFLFLLLNPLLSLLSPNDLDYTKYEALSLENASLKEEIKELSNISYTNYNYDITKILLKNNGKISPKNPVINHHGLIGITNTDNTLLTLDNLTISIRVESSTGIFKHQEIILNTKDIPRDDTPIYTSGLTNFPPNLSIGTLKSCKLNASQVHCKVNLNPIDTTYALILKDYSI